jgi:ribulose-5-phosphate 4-epimerase/fuculose-1-phosphate aldolase
MNLEGVIKFHVEHETAVSCGEADILELEKWRDQLRSLGLVGQDISKYGGFGFGNLSKRMRDGTYLITASQTGHLNHLAPGQYARIIRFNPAENLVWSQGLCHPSSETMTHLAIYGLNPEVQFVFHAHCREIWTACDELEIPVTNPAIEFGTPEMFYEVQALLKSHGHWQKGILAMGGHADGILAWGETADKAGLNLLSRLSRVVRN